MPAQEMREIRGDGREIRLSFGWNIQNPMPTGAIMVQHYSNPKALSMAFHDVTAHYY